MTEVWKEHYLNVTFYILSSFLSSVIFYLQPFHNIQMLKTRVDHDIILLQTMLKNATLVETVPRLFWERVNWRIFTLSIGITVDKICLFFLFFQYKCIAGNRTWLYRLPRSKIITYPLLFRCTATMWKNKKFLAVRRVWAWWPFARCRVDHLFPVTWFCNMWEWVPRPPSTGLSRLFNPRFPGLKIRYRYAVTWTCD